MKVLYFDCSSGISGNMTLGALLELCDDPDILTRELAKLHVEGYHMHITKTKKNGITGTYVDVHLTDHEHHHDTEHGHAHHHHHAHRNLFDVNQIIEQSDIAPEAKDLAKRIFMRVALAESKVHQETLENVHFHEVGAIDSIVDIVGTAILITYLKPDRIVASVVNDGHGFIECAHGLIAVPVPATSEIFAASDVISRQIDIDTELVTPTGAAIIAELCSSFGPMPALQVNKIGWGCGSKDLPIPNVLKVSLGTVAEQQDEVIVMETNIDDCSGEALGYTMEQLFQAGALDVFFTPIFMKKNRPAYRLTVVTKPQLQGEMEKLIFANTTTIGLRYRREQRTVLARTMIEVETAYGLIHAKKTDYGIYPEYEDMKQLALAHQVSLQCIQEAFQTSLLTRGKQ